MTPTLTQTSKTTFGPPTRDPTAMLDWAHTPNAPWYPWLIHQLRGPRAKHRSPEIFRALQRDGAYTSGACWTPGALGEETLGVEWSVIGDLRKLLGESEIPLKFAPRGALARIYSIRPGVPGAIEINDGRGCPILLGCSTDLEGYTTNPCGVYGWKSLKPGCDVIAFDSISRAARYWTYAHRVYPKHTAVCAVAGLNDIRNLAQTFKAKITFVTSFQKSDCLGLADIDGLKHCQFLPHDFPDVEREFATDQLENWHAWFKRGATSFGPTATRKAPVNEKAEMFEHIPARANIDPSFSEFTPD